MYNLRENLVMEQKRLLMLKEKIERNIYHDPEERRIRVSKSQGCAQFYLYSKDGPKRGKYIKKEEKELVQQLIQKTYDEKVLRLIDKRLSQFTRLLKDYQNDEIEKIYLSEKDERRKLIIPAELTYEQRITEWMKTKYEGKSFKEGMSEIITNSGIRVRSKSEKIMADYFDSANIPYKYECPLYLKSYGMVYPDFTFLSRKTGKEIYWEHEGMLDDMEYARSAVKKIETYQKHNIYPGENLILTFETSVTSINTTMVKELAERYLL